MAGDIESQNVRIIDVPDVAVENNDAGSRFVQMTTATTGEVELFRIIYKIVFKGRNIDFGDVEFQDVNKPDIPSITAKGSMLLPKMVLKKEVGFFWDRANKKLTGKCQPVDVEYEEDKDLLIKNFKITGDKPEAFIANEEIVDMRKKIKEHILEEFKKR